MPKKQNKQKALSKTGGRPKSGTKKSSDPEKECSWYSTNSIIFNDVFDPSAEELSHSELFLRELRIGPPWRFRPPANVGMFQIHF